MWNDPKTVEAFRQYMRILAGVAFFAVLLYMLIVDRIDVKSILSVFAGLSGAERIGQALVNRQQSKARNVEIAKAGNWE